MRKRILFIGLLLIAFGGTAYSVKLLSPTQKSSQASQQAADHLTTKDPAESSLPSEQSKAAQPSGSTTMTLANSPVHNTDNPTEQGGRTGPHIQGTNLSGLEFSGVIQTNSEPTFAYFKSKNFTTLRIPFNWEELQPVLHGDLDPTALSYLDQNVAWAKQNGQAVILDLHNYGRRVVYNNGGLTDDFTSNPQRTFRLSWGDQDAANDTLTFRDYGRGTAGTAANPVSPATSYATSFDARINTANDAASEFIVDVFYLDEANRYSLAINPSLGTWALYKDVNGVRTTLTQGSKAWALGQYYSFAVDVGQAAPGKINVSVDGTPLFAANSVDTDASLTHGYVSIFPAGVNVTLKNFVLNVAGDTSSGGGTERRLTDSQLPITAWQDFWKKLAKHYKNDPTVIAYDHNEPHDMPVPTSRTNYSYAAAAANRVPVASVTAIAQSMTNAIRSTGDTKYVVVELDHWANLHRFKDQYGAAPKPWITDSLRRPKIIYSAHYYFDDNHSGFYETDPTPPSNALIKQEATPFFEWCNKRHIPCFIGEFGVPNTPEWQPTLKYFMKLLQQHHIGWTQWAGGDWYSSITTIQPTDAYQTDRLQMTTIQESLQ